IVVVVDVVVGIVVVVVAVAVIRFGGLSKHKQFHCIAQIKKQFQCKFCEKTYNSLGALKMHIRTH
ncbi:unnamed protein product, partial [Rotaria sp. Silwood1]